MSIEGVLRPLGSSAANELNGMETRMEQDRLVY